MNRINRRLIFIMFPFVLGFLMFYLIPLIGSFRYSFVKSAFDQQFIGWNNYIDTLANRNFRLSVKNTFALIALGVPILVMFSMCLALLIKEMSDKLPLLRAALILPMLVPSAAIAGVFSKLSIENERIPLLAIYVWKNSGFLMLIFLAAFSMVSKDIYEAAAIDGAKKIRIFFNVTLPMTAGAILFAVILAVSYNLRLFREAYLLYGAYPDTNIYLTQHYMNNHFYQLNYQKLTTAASMFFTVLVIFVWFGLSVADRFIEERDNDI